MTQRKAKLDRFPLPDEIYFTCRLSVTLITSRLPDPAQHRVSLERVADP